VLESWGLPADQEWAVGESGSLIWVIGIMSEGIKRAGGRKTEGIESTKTSLLRTLYDSSVEFTLLLLLLQDSSLS